ncbi:MAG TPA: hypothetical protein VKH45_07345 [Candidatus Acidoferrum sp.]|nr:hypothetical protein [Candidatus Acidoferrum sp.]
MLLRSLIRLCFIGLLLVAGPVRAGSPDPPRDKTVWNYDGGLLMVTDGAVPNGGPCFHLFGRLTANEFFTNLRRVDSASGTLYKRGNDIITEFPEVMRLTIVLFDRPCSDGLEVTESPMYLSKAVVGSFHLGFSWKHGMAMRPVHGVSLKHAEAQLVSPYAEQLVEQLPKKYEWLFEFNVPGKGIPLTDSLVLVIYSPDGHIVARVAARL